MYVQVYTVSTYTEKVLFCLFSKVSVPANHMDQYSVRFIFGHMSAGNRPRYDQHAVAFLKLVTKEGTAIPDGIHELNLFPVSLTTLHIGSAIYVLYISWPVPLLSACCFMKGSYSYTQRK